VIKRTLYVCAIILALGLWMPTRSAADPISCLSLGGASCSGTLTYDQATHDLTVTLQNTGDGIITSLGVETPGNQTADALEVGTNAGWTLSTNPGNFGLGATWDMAAGGGTANGVSQPDFLTVIFHLIGANLDTLVASDFTGEANKTGTCGDEGLAWGCLHVQNLESQQGGSLKIPLQAGSTSVPEPGTLVLLGAGLVGLGAISRRKLGK
jgi:hypothetical protein